MQERPLLALQQYITPVQHCVLVCLVPPLTLFGDVELFVRVRLWILSSAGQAVT